MDIYIEGTPADELLATITCGDVGLEGAVVVPKSLYQSIEEKLSALAAGKETFSGEVWEKRREALTGFWRIVVINHSSRTTCSVTLNSWSALASRG